jgi:cytidylate kinase
MSIIVAIDGPAGAGKSTIAKLVAQRLEATLLDTGAIYRSLALAAQRRGVDWGDESALTAIAEELPLRFELRDGVNHVLLADEDISSTIRTPEMSAGASQVSGLPRVRAALLEMQRRFADRGSVVAEGRDIGTVVFPRATVKVFMVADERARARRRLGDLRAAGDQQTTLEQVLEAQRRRDAADSGRAVAPLVPADDATRLDTSTMSIEQTVDAVIGLVPPSPS